MLALTVSLLLCGVLAEIVQAIEVPIPTKEQMVYGDFPVVGRRVAVWIIAQLHLMFGAFVVGVPLFILDHRDSWARRRRVSATTIWRMNLRACSAWPSRLRPLLAVFWSFSCSVSIPLSRKFLARIFFPSMVVYVFLFFGESFSMYLYYYGWEALKGTSRRAGAVVSTAVLTTAGALSRDVSWSAFLLKIFGAAPPRCSPCPIG